MEKKRNRKIKYRTLICSAAGAFFCGFSANWGSQLDRNGNVAVTDLYSWLIPFLTACVLTPVFYLVVEKLTGIEASGDRLVSHSNKKAPDAGQQLQRGWKKLFQSPILRYAIILFLCWLPVFLAVYPGFFAYDATEELQEVLTGNGCNIKVRLGLHEASEEFCANDGLIVLQPCGEKAQIEALVEALNGLEGVSARLMDLN